jgi:2',3'-cyclic-nucleotide 2'-phosphodiesterase/3'-nucleotidase
MPGATEPRLRRRLLRALLLCAAAGALCVSSIGLATVRAWRAGPPARVALTLLATTDLHGHVAPVNEETGGPANLGLAKIATLVARERATHPHTLLLDCGDATEGTPLAWYAVRRSPSAPDPIIAAMNLMGYAAMAVGNHEFDFGMDHLRKIASDAHFPILAANADLAQRPEESILRPWAIREIAGIRVAIAGLVTPGVVRWEPPENYNGYTFHPLLERGPQVVAALRQRSDLVVVLAHSGLGAEPGAPFAAGIPGEIADENSAAELAAEAPGIDVLLFGHSHRELPEKFIHGVLLAQPGNWGRSLAEVQVEMERGAGGWRVTSKHSSLLPVTAEVPAAPEVMQAVAGLQAESDRYFEQPVATVAQPLSGAAGRIEDSPLVDWIHAAQLEAGHADVSLATLFNTHLRIPAGKVTRRQFFALYPYENMLYTVEMSGAQLKALLEMAAGFYPHWPLASGVPPALPGYQADTAWGVSYLLDLTAAPSFRIRELTYHGQPLEGAEKLRVAVNHFRYYGGGGYGMVYRAMPIVARSTEGIRELLIAWAGRKGALPVAPGGNWRIEPDEARQALLRAAIQ